MLTLLWSRAWPRLRRALYWTHRWLGIVGCLLFVMWFLSGLVMMYVGYPSLTQSERLSGLAPLQAQTVRISPTEVLGRLPPDVRDRPPRRMTLEMMIVGAPGAPGAPRVPDASTRDVAQPVWRVLDAKGRPSTWSAVDGRPVDAIGSAQAQSIAQRFAHAPEARFAETLERDQWTVPQGLDALRPLHRIEVGDAAGTELYVSAVTGEVVRDTTRHERFWNWLGSVPHWIYFTPLRADPPLWRDVVIWVSGGCIASAVTGLVIGLMRVRLRRRFKNGACTPYSGWMRWHHIAGLIGGLFVLTWVTSGWLSMDPNRWFQRAGTDEGAQGRWLGRFDPSLAGPLASPLPDARELQLLAFNGHLLLQWRDAGGHRTVIDASTGAPLQLSREDVLAAADRFMPGGKLAELRWLTEEDAHWYGHHAERLLPVWRLVFADEAGTWLHVDPASGQIVGRGTANSRLRRWLFNAPHNMDFPWLIQHRPLWDAVVWALSAVGLLVSISGVVIGWRRLGMATRGRARRS